MFSGDAVTWSTPDIARPNLSAWLVCANMSLWINLGNYAYLTPTGCVDETVSLFFFSVEGGGVRGMLLICDRIDSFL